MNEKKSHFSLTKHDDAATINIYYQTYTHTHAHSDGTEWPTWFLRGERRPLRPYASNNVNLTYKQTCTNLLRILLFLFLLGVLVPTAFALYR